MEKKQKNTSKEAMVVLWIVMGLNFGVALLKIIIGKVVGSGSIIADGYHSISDGSGNIVGLVGLFIASRPVDENHPYGHKKFETISSMVIGMILLFLGARLGYNSVFYIINPQKPEISLISFLVMVFTLVINIFVVRYERSQGERLNSDVLLADSEHTKSDILITSGVIIAMIFLYLGFPPVIDGLVSMIIAGIIIKTGLKIFLKATSTLTDSAVLDAKELSRIVMTCRGVEECHNVRSRGRKDDIYVDMHVKVNPDMKVSESHALEHCIEDAIKLKFGKQVSVMIHVEPKFRV